MTRLVLCLLVLAPVTANARPYYAAKKGLSCAACHVAPAGGGMRNTKEGSPGRITDRISVGGDLRAFFMDTQGAGISQFNLGRTALYAAAEPKPGISLVVHQQSSEDKMAQGYGLWRSQSALLPLYVRAGRFWLPYGLQWDDIDNSIYGRLNFAPGVGFDMSSANSDTGVEIGLAPKKHYFANLAVTNGQPAAGGDVDRGKAFTARGGWIHESFMIGGSVFHNKTGPLPGDQTRTRYGPMAWTSFGPAVLMYEGGFGKDKPNTGAEKKLASHAAELDVEPLKDWLIKGRFDSHDPDTSLSGDDIRRYSFGVERMLDNASIEGTYRIHKEKPSVKNDVVLIQGHIWF